MKIEILPTRQELGTLAGKQGAAWIKEIIAAKGEVNIILATGQSQFETIETLINDTEIEWSKVRMFHLDEYIGMPITHKASFRKYLTERFVDKVAPLLEVVLINGEQNAEDECVRLDAIIKKYPIDVAFVGIGENGHLAFNDPPADFHRTEAYIVVNLDAQCRQQQMGEGWFNTIEEVPLQAISMSIQQIMNSARIICAVPDQRKAQAVKNCLSSAVSNQHPASILQQHANCICYLDEGSASLLKT
ncbi:glucosamine-6-phosphate deaminase [Sphingobacteriaceae bacterium WQ 2009]|uniref:Glucosamine-6-phosphate deaminase n=1 Tax=Rhinopithecimicrobium faecis TaxID=2820698 RepID=A0A8T4HCS5_9SPHI|nr:glucosamine-6-phosphate deaminase [Sphingobacteriaceae bacterium WQ 2009]